MSVRVAARRCWTLILYLCLAGCGGTVAAPGAATNQAASCNVSGTSTTVVTHSYTMSLVVGAPEAMYSPAEAAAKHPTAGEVMLRGTMSSSGGGVDVGGMDMGGGGSLAPSTGSVRHLEVHICSRATGKVVGDAEPSLVLLDPATGRTESLAVAVMQGVTAGPEDVHYGNNVDLAPGHQVTLTVTLAGEEATFALQP